MWTRDSFGRTDRDGFNADRGKWEGICWWGLRLTDRHECDLYLVNAVEVFLLRPESTRDGTFAQDLADVFIWRFVREVLRLWNIEDVGLFLAKDADLFMGSWLWSKTLWSRSRSFCFWRLSRWEDMSKITSSISTSRAEISSLAAIRFLSCKRRATLVVNTFTWFLASSASRFNCKCLSLSR